jgi:hypothetical protein
VHKRLANKGPGSNCSLDLRKHCSSFEDVPASKGAVHGAFVPHKVIIQDSRDVTLLLLDCC